LKTPTAPSLLRAAGGALLAACAPAQAELVFTASTPEGRFGTGDAAFVTAGEAGIADTTSSVHAAPFGVSDGQAYFYVTPAAGSITFEVHAASFGFLWGSPDELNRVTYHTSLGDFAIDGFALWKFGIAAQGDRSVSTFLNASMADAGGLIDSVTFTSGSWSFEYALLEAPEPGTLALALAALAAAGWSARRRRAG